MRDIRDAFPSKYLKASDLKGKDVKVQIDKVEYEAVGQTKDIKPVLYFGNTDKGLVLNKTNCNALIALTTSAYPDEWQGIYITIYPTETSFQGEQVECIRIRKDPPAKRAATRAQRNDAIPIRKRGKSEPEPEPEPESPAPDDDSGLLAHVDDDDIPF